MQFCSNVRIDHPGVIRKPDGDGWHAACKWHGAMRTAITLSLPECGYLRCLRVLGAWWCLGLSALQPRLLLQYEARP